MNIKYLKYAVGEIVLVVIGILIALQVNNWNEERKERKLEQRIIAGLLEEMSLNRDLLVDSYKTHRFHDSTLNALIMNPESSNLEEQIKNIINFTYYRTTDFRNGNVQSILSEHGPSILTNDTLRNFVVSWEDMKNDILENEKIEENMIHQRIYPFLSQNFDFGLMFKSFSGDATSMQRMSEEGPSLVKTLLDNKEFQGIIMQRKFNESGVQSDMYNTLAELDTAISVAKRIVK
ncbi:MAG: hypothetical protein HWE21_00745 [Cytophagia bacterium]|nr:hypothetical protein [Cytophagia bacterium]